MTDEKRVVARHDALAALAELVRLKDIKDRLDATEERDLSAPRNYAAEDLRERYERDKPKAWEVARAIVAGSVSHGRKQDDELTPQDRATVARAMAAFHARCAELGVGACPSDATIYEKCCEALDQLRQCDGIQPVDAALAISSARGAIAEAISLLMHGTPGEKPVVDVQSELRAALDRLREVTAKYLGVQAQEGIDGIAKWLWTGEGTDKLREEVGDALARAYFVLNKPADDAPKRRIPDANQVRYMVELLRAARCPDPNCNDGSITSTGPDPQNDACQWCYERHLTIESFGVDDAPKERKHG